MTAMACRCSTDCDTGGRTGGCFCMRSTLLELNGQDTRREPLEMRKRTLAAVLRIKAEQAFSSTTNRPLFLTLHLVRGRVLISCARSPSYD